MNIVPLLIALLLLTSSCTHHYSSSNNIIIVEKPLELASISIVDRNGFSETISNVERLGQFQNTDFFSSQPYQKVLRIYKRDECGDIYAHITSYHPNGQIKQYLEVLNHRAHGAYKEWHSNGALALSGFVIGGEPDIDSNSQLTWLFDGTCKAFDECNNLIAEIPYAGGSLEGVSVYYHANGNVWKRIPYFHNEIEGTLEIYRDNGVLLQTIPHHDGVKQGCSMRYWEDGSIASEEIFNNGLLITARYFELGGKQIGCIENGNGQRVVFGKEAVSELQEFHNGIMEGKVQVFGENGFLLHCYHIKDDLKDGEEIEYYPFKGSLQLHIPQLSVNWSNGRIQGLVKTWYPDGTPESQREMSSNKKNGVLTAWYEDGSVMLIERYEQDKLIEGQYFSRSEKIPVSEIHGGRGTATIFDSKGNLLRKVQYNNSKPSE